MPFLETRCTTDLSRYESCDDRPCLYRMYSGAQADQCKRVLIDHHGRRKLLASSAVSFLYCRHRPNAIQAATHEPTAYRCASLWQSLRR
jgi:hypothetical protein